MVTRTGLFSQRSIRPLRSAELVDLTQQLFNPAADLLALGAQRFHFGRKLGGLLLRGFLLLAQPVNELHGLVNPLLETAEGIVVVVGGLHLVQACAALTFSANSRKPASSFRATSASTLRSSVMPASL